MNLHRPATSLCSGPLGTGGSLPPITSHCAAGASSGGGGLSRSSLARRVDCGELSPSHPSLRARSLTLCLPPSLLSSSFPPSLPPSRYSQEAGASPGAMRSGRLAEGTRYSLRRCKYRSRRCTEGALAVLPNRFS
ncbi:uncharacterized protein LOC144456992 [Phascolarctos cinereus]